MDEYPIIDLSHLLPAAQGLARLPADERIQRLRADRWIGYPRAVEALNRLEALYAWPNKQRMPNLLLVGPTNNGKSMIVEKFRRTHPASSDADQEHIPVLVVQMPSEPSVIRFYVALLAAMGAPLRPRPRLPEMEQLALALLRKVGVRMLVIDELHNVLAGNSVNRREFLNLLRFLGNELRIPLVGVGTRDAYLAIRSDDQLENRFEPMMLPVWEANDDCCSLLASFAASLPLRRPSPIATLDMARYLLTRSEGTIGELAHLLMAAAIVAVESGEEAINHRTLSMACGTAGVALLVLTPNAALDPVGVAAGLAGAVSMAFGTVLTRKWQPPVPLLTFTAWQLAAGGLLLVPVALVFDPPIPMPTGTNVLGLAWLGLIGAGLTYFLWFRGISRLEPTVVSLLGFLSPGTAVLLGWLFLDQTLSALQTIGVLLVIGSIWLGQRSNRTPRARIACRKSP